MSSNTSSKPTKNDYAIFTLSQIDELRQRLANWEKRIIYGNMEQSHIIKISNILTKINKA
jgi:hypothetical protein